MFVFVLDFTLKHIYKDVTTALSVSIIFCIVPLEKQSH